MVYVVWGSTYLGLEEAGQTLPPFLLLAARFGVAGPLLLAIVLRRGEPLPTLAEWRSSAIVGHLPVSLSDLSASPSLREILSSSKPSRCRYKVPRSPSSSARRRMKAITLAMC